MKYGQNSEELDHITLKSLRFDGKHGYLDKEREAGNRFELDVKAAGYFKASIRGSDLKKTFDYNLVKKVAEDVFTGPSEKLIESLCKRIGDRIFEQAPLVEEMSVSLRKLNPPIGAPCDYAEITMTWKR
jgi:dihydroneopterin aldolase